MPNRIPIWLDCDPGHDDAVAILIACFNPVFNLMGISATYGNSSPKNTNYNVRSLLTALAKTHDVPVYSGAQKPWYRDAKYASNIHGESGLDGTDLLPTPTVESHDYISYLDAMEDVVARTEGKLAFVATGPLTSLATFIKERPFVKGKIRYVSSMGGVFDAKGNMNDKKSAEFNVYSDPEAANYVFHDHIIKDRLILTPLNLTHKAIVTTTVKNNIRGDGTCQLRQLFFELFEYFSKTYKDVQNFKDGPPLHDPLVLMPLLQFYGYAEKEDLDFQFKRMDISVVEDQKSPDDGKTLSEKEYLPDSEIGTIVGFNMNMEFFWKQVYDAMDKAAPHSTIEK